MPLKDEILFLFPRDHARLQMLVDAEDATVLLQILQNHTGNNKIILRYGPLHRKITTLRQLKLSNDMCIPSPPLLSGLKHLKKLELRDCQSLPIQDLTVMTSLKWLNICSPRRGFGKSFSFPSHRAWYPPNLKTFLINGVPFKSDPLDSLIATCTLMECPPGYYILPDCIKSSRFIKRYHEESGRITELRLSFHWPNAWRLPPIIGQLEMLQELWLYNVSFIPKELSNLVHLRVLRLYDCGQFSALNPILHLPSVVDVQVRTRAPAYPVSWIMKCVPNLKSLAVLGLTCYFEVIWMLRGVTKYVNPLCSICFKDSLERLSLSLAWVINERGCDMEGELLEILKIYPNLAELVLRNVNFRIGRAELVERNVNFRIGRTRPPPSNVTVFKVLSRQPSVYEISIGGKNIFMFDNHLWRYFCWKHWPIYLKNNDIQETVLNLTRCGRQLLNQKSIDLTVLGTKFNFEQFPYFNFKQIPIALWAHVLERAQRVSDVDEYSSNRKWLTIEEDDSKRLLREAYCLHFLLRHGPAFAFRETLGFEFVKRTNKGKLGEPRKRKR